MERRRRNLVVVREQSPFPSWTVEPLDKPARGHVSRVMRSVPWSRFAVPAAEASLERETALTPPPTLVFNWMHSRGPPVNPLWNDCSR